MPRVAYEDECWHCGMCRVECPKQATDITHLASFW